MKSSANNGGCFSGCAAFIWTLLNDKKERRVRPAPVAPHPEGLLSLPSWSPLRNLYPPTQQPRKLDAGGDSGAQVLPCCGASSAGTLSWSLKCSGMMPLAHTVFTHVQKRFQEDFPHTVNEEEAYDFGPASNLKPTQIECRAAFLNQSPQCTISGEIQLCPYYEVDAVKAAVGRYVDELNNGDVEFPLKRGPFGNFTLPAEVETQPREVRKDLVELKW